MTVLRTDNGLEFVNHEVGELLQKQGIRHQRSVVYTPQQNGRAEREIRTLVEAARSMISGMEKHFWAEAVNTASYNVINRTGKSSMVGKTPYELWFNKKPDLKGFRIFGSTISVHVPKETRLKWDPKNRIGIFVGYNEEVKGYRVFFLEKDKLEFHRDVIFLPEKEKGVEMQNKAEPLVQIDNVENIPDDITENMNLEDEMSVTQNVLNEDDDLNQDTDEGV